MSVKAVKLGVVTGAAVAAMLVLGLTAAYATRTVRIASHISIKDSGLTFRGKVTSPNSACDSPRKVKLYRTNGNFLGSTTTNSAGRWKITVSGSAGISLGHFYARVTRRSEGTAGTIYVCKSAVSKTIPWHP